MTAPWTSRCESGNCVQTRTVGDLVEVRDTERPEQVPLKVSARAWAEHEAAVRAEGYRQAVEALRSAGSAAADWLLLKNGARIARELADYLALTEVRDDKETTR
jgi:hypothetical protein